MMTETFSRNVYKVAFEYLSVSASILLQSVTAVTFDNPYPHWYQNCYNLEVSIQA